MDMVTDKEFLLAVLEDGRPHTLNEILMRSFNERGCGLTVHSRAAELRSCGHRIENTKDPKKRRGDGSVYRLVRAQEAQPTQAADAAPPRLEQLTIGAT
jgi:hypothetical protein